jgi:poly-gamma-glutamate synthesis protein (capsule biosynthesis protein)
VKFAFLAYTTYINTSAKTRNDYGVNIFSKELAAKQIAEAKSNGAQAIIVSMRWGTEYSSSVDEEQQADAKFLASQGVTLVLGHGPHVVQPVEELTGSNGSKTVVWYSLGNFLNTQEEAEALFNGIAIIDFDTQSHKITKMQYLPIYMHYEWTPQQKAAENLLARKNLHLYVLDDATQALIDSNQLKTTIAAQKDRLQAIINKNLTIPFITKTEFLQQD